MTGVARPGTMEMVVLPPIETEGLADADVKRLTARTHAAIAEELGVKPAALVAARHELEQ